MSEKSRKLTNKGTKKATVHRIKKIASSDRPTIAARLVGKGSGKGPKKGRTK